PKVYKTSTLRASAVASQESRVPQLYVPAVGCRSAHFVFVSQSRMLPKLTVGICDAWTSFQVMPKNPGASWFDAGGGTGAGGSAGGCGGGGAAIPLTEARRLWSRRLR